jgi:hypothetical protein
MLWPDLTVGSGRCAGPGTPHATTLCASLLNPRGPEDATRRALPGRGNVKPICRGLGAERIDKAIVRNAISQLGTAR